MFNKRALSVALTLSSYKLMPPSAAVAVIFTFVCRVFRQPFFFPNHVCASPGDASQTGVNIHSHVHTYTHTHAHTLWLPINQQST